MINRKWELCIPLYNLYLESEEGIILNENERIVPLNSVNLDIPKENLKFVYLTYQRINQPRVHLDRTLVTFKMYKDSMVLSNYWIIGQTREIQGLNHYIHWRKEELPVYHIRKNEESDFTKTWYFLKDINTRNFALNRFHLASYDPYLEYRVITYVQCLEHIFAPVSGGKVKMSRNGSKIIKKSCDNSIDEIEGMLVEFYNLRSATIHGNKTKKIKIMRQHGWDRFNWEFYLRILRQYCRIAITFCVENDFLDDTDKRREYFNRL